MFSWLWHVPYSVGPHPVSTLHIYTLVVSRAFMVGAANQAGDAESSRAPGLTSGLQGSVNVHRCSLLLVPQWQCISSFFFIITLGERTLLLYRGDRLWTNTHHGFNRMDYKSISSGTYMYQVVDYYLFDESKISEYSNYTKCSDKRIL